MRRFVRPFLNLVILAGLILAVWPLGQSVYGHWSQRALSQQWQQEQQGAPRHAQPGAKAQSQKRNPKLPHNDNRKKNGVKASSRSAVGKNPDAKRAKIARWPLTKLSIPDIGVETFIVQGWDDAALRRGPGHWQQSTQAGQGNCVVAGHSNIYGSPFGRLSELMPGATISLANRQGTFNYTVSSVFPVPDFNRQILAPPAPGEAPRLTLITCTVPHTNNRIVVQATLVAG